MLRQVKQQGSKNLDQYLTLLKHPKQNLIQILHRLKNLPYLSEELQLWRKILLSLNIPYSLQLEKYAGARGH